MRNRRAKGASPNMAYAFFAEDPNAPPLHFPSLHLVLCPFGLQDSRGC